MKGNDGSGNNSSRDDWKTPPLIFDPLNEQYNFDFDCCASVENTKCVYWRTDFEASENTTMKAWMNPPFSKARSMFNHFFKVVKKGVAIYRCDNLETEIWQKVILPKCSWIFIPDKRVCYDGLSGDGARFPSALIGIGLEPPKNLKGITMEVKSGWKRLRNSSQA